MAWNPIKAVFNRSAPLPPAAEPETEAQIPPDLMEKIRAIQVRANYLANDIMAGEYVSAFKGRGMEFSEVREYLPGDDIRLIDWNVTARMGHPFIKEFREERELTLMLIVDVSSSGDFGTVNKFKNEVSAELASILAYLAIKNNDKIGLMVFSDKIEHYVPPKKGRGHVWNIIRTILNFKPQSRKTDLKAPLEYLMRVHKRKMVTFFISDFQDSGYEASFKLAKQKHDLIAVSVYDPREADLPNIGWLHLEDRETGEKMFVDTSDRDLMKDYKKRVEAIRANRNRFFNSIGIDTIEIDTDGSLVNPILKYFKLREHRH